MVEKAKELCEDLLGKVKEEYEEFKSRPPRSYGDRGGYNDRRGGYGDRHGGHSYSNNNNNNNAHQVYGSYNAQTEGQGQGQGQGAGGAASPPPAAGSNAGGNDYAAQYAQYYGGQDPYAAYGGYAA